MNLIPDNATLLRYVPNTLKTVQGETPLFDKIRFHIQQSEQWLADTFTSNDTLARIASYTSSNSLLHHCRMATAAHAMLLAIPQLDLILTPNGFGIVSNQNIAPASKERVERLLLSLEKLRDDALQIILSMLPTAHHWTASHQYEYFAATMFPCLDTIHHLGFSDHIWQHYQEVHAQLLTIEQRLETEYFSKPLMDTLRTANILNKWEDTIFPDWYRRLFQRIFAIEFSILRTGEYPMPSIIDMVNYIRTSPSNVFHEWKTSDTAKLFESHGYKNKKESSGYFF